MDHRSYKTVAIFAGLYWLSVFIAGCKTDKKLPAMFEVLDSKRTGLSFSNDLSYNKDFNLFKYIYFYNGSGAGAGDFNNDGLIDLFFGSNQHDNKLYLNAGDLNFRDVTKDAGIPGDGGWTTGISVVDINNDGLLDIYVCRVGQYETLKSKNQLLICQGIDQKGIPSYKDMSHEYGLDFSGFSTQAAFFDYDMDGDLDMFLLNHSVHENGTFRPRKDFAGTYHALSGDRFYRNDGKFFTDVTKESGINSTGAGYGLAIAVSDINLDGYPDIYIGNDFHENDYLYINLKNGTFREEGEQHLMHTSQYTMGADVADINNDGFPEIISTDMLPYDPYILKRSLGGDDYDIFKYKTSVGYSAQYPRNNLQYNRKNGLFSEIGLYSGIAATDWSWAPLWIDFDNDGLKDLFVSNGIPKRLNDIDYVNYVSNEEIQSKIRSNRVEDRDMALINKFPQIKLPNRFFTNKGNALFEDANPFVDGDRDTYSNGSVYADFDNDGDLDIVVNNIDEPALLYRNNANDNKDKPSVRLKLEGAPANRNAVGAKVFVFSGKSIMTYEKQPVRGFQSSMEMPLQMGLNKINPDSVFLVWPDNSFQQIILKKDSLLQEIRYKPGLPAFDYSMLNRFYTNDSPVWEDITRQTDLLYRHEENPFIEFDREPLMPFMVSGEGPALAVADMNSDGLEDVFIGSSKGKKSAVFIQQPSGKFKKEAQSSLENDSTYEDVDACWEDINKDGFKDLVIASGGNEYYGNSAFLLPRAYLNDGHGKLVKKNDAFNNVFVTASVVAACDFNEDKNVDLFIGGRAVPWEYGKIPRSCLMQNDGTGRFIDVTDKYAPGLANAGFVKHAVWVDIDNDKDKDLVLSLEWDGICVFINNKGVFTKRYITDKKGWWNFVMPCDLDNDGDMDFIAGNEGLNSRLTASEKEPVRFYYYDFDGNGKKEQLITYYLQGRETTFASKSDLEKQMPGLKKKFLYAADFAKASIKEIFGADKLAKAKVFSADFFSSAMLINDGKSNFTVKALPWEAQFTSYHDAIPVNVNKDMLPGILLAGNFYDNNIQMGRYDADFGTLLVNKGKGNLVCEKLNGLTIRGEVRHIRPISIGDKKALIIARNNDSLEVISFH